MSIISIITCVVGIIGCVIGIATFASAQITKAKQDGMLVAKLDQCVSNTEQIRLDMKERNKEIDKIIDRHSESIIKLETQMRIVNQKLKIREENANDE